MRHHFGRRGLTTWAVALIFVSGGHVRAQTSSGMAAVRAAIDAGNKKFSEGAVKHDAALIASVYSEDALAFPANAVMVKGKPALQQMWQSVLDSGITSFVLRTTEVQTAGDLAYEVGTYEMGTQDGKVADQGKYCVVWKRVNGQWLLHRDIWTTNLPAAGK